jgi:hypothetical protein
MRTVRVDDDLWAAAIERAAENGETVSAAVRRFLKWYVAGAVVVLVAILTGCGSEEPAEVVQPVASQAPEVAVSQPVESVPTYTEPLPTTATATDCWQLTGEVLNEVNAAPGPELIAYLQALPDPSEGCTDRDQNALRAFDEQLDEYLDTEQG